MDKLDFSGDMIYQDGWFVYTRNNKETCVLTRDDARMVENAYREYLDYANWITGMQRMVEGVMPFEVYGFSKKTPRCRGNDIGTVILPSSVKYLNHGALPSGVKLVKR